MLVDRGDATSYSVHVDFRRRLLVHSRVLSDASRREESEDRKRKSERTFLTLWGRCVEEHPALERWNIVESSKPTSFQSR